MIISNGVNKLLQVLVFLIIIITSVVVGVVVLHFSETEEKAEDISTPNIKEEKVEHEGQNSANQEEAPKENLPEGEQVPYGATRFPTGQDREEGTEETPETDWQWVNNQEKLYRLTPIEVNLILKELSLKFPKKEERLKALATLRLGTPYQLGCLGEESGRDKDPIFRLDVADCTVFVLTTAALLHSQNLNEAKEMMKFLNYQPDSEITFENRLHFTTDRNMTSPYFRDITTEVAGLDKVKEKKITLNKIKADGKRLIDIDWEKELVIKYIPNELITKEFFEKLPPAIGIAFIKEGDEEIGLDVRHEGFLVDGKLLFHASSVQGKVVAEDFFEYYFGNHPRFDSIILFDPVVNF